MCLLGDFQDGRTSGMEVTVIEDTGGGLADCERGQRKETR